MSELDLFKSEKLSRAMNAIAEAVIITDPGGAISYVNPAFEKITGYSSEEVIGQNPRVLKSGQNDPSLYKDMWDTLLQGKIWRGELINKRKDGSIYNAKLTISPVWTDSNRVISYVAVQGDVTTQKGAEKLIRLKTEEYRVLHEVAQALQKTGTLKQVLNGAMEAITKFDELQMEYKAGVFLADEERRELSLFTTVGDFSDEFLARDKIVPYGDCLCGRSAESGEMLVSNSCFSDERHERTFSDMTAHGHYIVPLKSQEKLIGVLFLYTHENPPFYERSGEILLSIGALIADAIQHRRVEEETRRQKEELATANAKLKQLNELKNKFLGIASHNLRNPICLISSFSEALLETSLGPVNEQQADKLKKIYSSSEHMRVLLTNLLDISKIESGKIEIDKKPQDFNEIVKNQVDLHQLIANKKNIKLHLATGEVPAFPFDKDVVIQAIDNFTGNAIKFSPPDSEIFIATESQTDRVLFSVRDTGPGISEDDQKLLFGEFQTLSAKPTGGEKSTGLGLAIVKKIVTLHGGEVGAKSQLGKGATFFFTLPYK